jgi:P-type Cu2+ transporter
MAQQKDDHEAKNQPKDSLPVQDLAHECKCDRESGIICDHCLLNGNGSRNHLEHEAGLQDEEDDLEKHHGHIHAEHEDHHNESETEQEHSHEHHHGHHSLHHGERHDHSGHDHSDHSHHDPAAFRKLFGISLALTIPTIAYSHVVQEFLGFTMPEFPLSHYLPAVLGTVLLIVGGRVFLKGGLHELRTKKPGMMALISLALLVAFFYSAFVTVLQIFGVKWMGMDFWWELATLITIMLLGHWIEMSSIAKASGALGALAALIPDTADRLDGEEIETVPVDWLRVGDLVLVRPGAAIPADGEILEGSSSIDESMLTGESKPVERHPGDKVVAGSINGSNLGLGKGSLTVKVTSVGSETVLAGVVRLVKEAQSSKTKTQLLADRAAGWLFYLAFVSAIITLITWVAIGGFSPDFILEKVVTVLVIACPHALGLAIPLVSSITSALAAGSGVIIRNKVDFEAARKLDIILFDKTGTLTTASREVKEIRLSHGSTFKKPEQVLKLAAQLEKTAEHSLAIAILEKANQEGISFRGAGNVEFIPGVGVVGSVQGKSAMAGSAALLTRRNIKIHVSDLVEVDALNKAGNSVVYVVLDNQLVGYLAVGDSIRESSAEAIRALRMLGKPVAILSGDATGVVESVAKELEIDEYYGELLPEGKIELVKKLQSEGLRVGFVGDGVNDAPALAQADVGMAIGAGTDVAIESAGVVLVSSDPVSVAKVISLSSRSHKKMVQNLWWAAGYNIAAIPLAAGAAFGIGFTLTPAVGAVLMSLSTLIVAANAQLLRRQ